MPKTKNPSYKEYPQITRKTIQTIYNTKRNTIGISSTEENMPQNRRSISHTSDIIWNCVLNVLEVLKSTFYTNFVYVIHEH